MPITCLRHFALVLAILPLVGLTSTAAADAGRERGVTLYAAGDFRGNSETFSYDVPSLHGTRVGNDHASSIRVHRDCTVTLYEHPDYRGLSTTLRHDSSDLGRTEVGNDRVSSLRIRCERRGGGDIDWGGRRGVALYSNGDFSGRREIFYDDDRDLRNNRIRNDTASSVSLAPGCRVTLYAAGDYRGRSVDLERDVANLGTTQVGNDTVSSLRVDCGGRGDRPGRPWDNERDSVTLYAEGDYRGRSETFYRDVEDLNGSRVGNDHVSSVRVSPGCRVVLFEHPAFRGSYSELTYDTRSLQGSSVGNDRVSSLQLDCGRWGRGRRHRGEPRDNEPRYDEPRRDDRGHGYPGFSSGDRRSDRGGVTIFRHEDFQGPSETFYDDVRDLGRTPLGNDTASSVRVDPGCRVILYAGGDFRGERTELSSDVSRLRFTPVGNDTVSSIEVDCRR